MLGSLDFWSSFPSAGITGITTRFLWCWGLDLGDRTSWVDTPINWGASPGSNIRLFTLPFSKRFLFTDNPWPSPLCCRPPVASPTAAQQVLSHGGQTAQLLLRPMLSAFQLCLLSIVPLFNHWVITEHLLLASLFQEEGCHEEWGQMIPMTCDISDW